ncbi:hypothetical protein PYV50_09540 [Pseudomonas sp. H22_DOA]|nr:hypothetical protein PYV50_09540 [Pseudomonas sp. H22_DOA]
MAYGLPDNEYVQLLSLSANVLDKVFVTRSTVTVQRRPYVDFTASAAGAGAAPEEIFRADFTPQSRYALLYLLQRAAIVNAKGTHLLLPATLAKPLEAFFEEVAEKGRDRIDLMFTLVFADNAKVPAGAINSALFELPADVQALQHPRLAVVELATVPDIDVAGWQEDNMLEVIALRPAGTELVRTWRRRVTVDGSGAASEAEFGKYLAARFDMQEFEVTDVGSGTPLIDADDALPQASEVAIPNEYPEQMRNWLAAEKPVGFDDHDLRYDVIVPLSRLVSPGQDSPSPYAAIGKSFKLDLGWRDIYGNQLGVVAWSDTIEHCYTDPLVPVSAWPCIQTRVYAGAAGSCEMVLEFAVDQNALPQGDDRAIVARELLRVLHQLLDPNTSISALSSLQPAARRKVDRAKLASFVARFRDDLLVGTAPSIPATRSASATISRRTNRSTPSASRSRSNGRSTSWAVCIRKRKAHAFPEP